MMKCTFNEDDTSFTIIIINALAEDKMYGSVHGQLLKSSVIGYFLDHLNNINIYLNSGAIFNLSSSIGFSGGNNPYFEEFTKTEEGSALIENLVKCLQNTLSQKKSKNPDI